MATLYKSLRKTDLFNVIKVIFYCMLSIFKFAYTLPLTVQTLQKSNIDFVSSTSHTGTFFVNPLMPCVPVWEQVFGEEILYEKTCLFNIF